MGELNTVPMRINKIEGAAGQVKLSGGAGAIETWGAPAPAAHVHAAGDVTSGQFPLTRMPRAATGNFLEGNGVGADPVFNVLIAGNIPSLAATKITSGQFPLARMPRGVLGEVITGQGVGADPVYAAPAGGGPEIVYKAADEAVNDSNVLQDDDDLKIACLANELWEFCLTAYIFTPNAATDFKFAFTVPALAAIQYVFAGLNAAAAWQYLIVNSSGDPIVVDTAGSKTMIAIHGLAQFGGNAGDIQFRWAQDTPMAVDTKVMKGACMIAHKLA